ncbi:PAS domain-containing sensor histidine kinase [Microvirga sp. 17 mud 1-3]|uniref:sensor histidine kinase n=1 Tax=Microvirga sp. 17 mud 1-3 TaxID=2082949 RepID=UPI000D6ACA51|nr:PAS domain-containing sensor histidine kinase [Microvirga sp. 17 mud 1-3]AWM88694.1 two-component sensor histidine kinase [Microvirga sp. 17 mud 1-3]
MARHGERHDGSGGRTGPRLRVLAPLAAAFLSGTAWPARAVELPASLTQSAEDLLRLLHGWPIENAAYFGLFLGLVAFSTTTALLLLREQRRHARTERALRTELAALRGADDLAGLLMGSERQLLVSWQGRDAEPRFEGDPSVIGEGAPAQRALAFGAWLAPGDAKTLDTALEQLRQRGETFRLTARTLGSRFIDVEGRTVGGRAILRLRDVTLDRAELLTVRSDLAGAQEDLRAMTDLLDAIAHPLWIRDETDRLLWANRAYLNAVEASDVADATARSLDLLGQRTRDESRRLRQGGNRFAARVTAVMAGQRSILDVVEHPTGNGSAGIAIDVSELEAVRTDLQRQMDAHVRTLDQLPTAVAIFDASQQLIFTNAAYQQLWGLDSAFLGSRPTDGEVLDRLYAARKLPEQADFRAWKTEILASYRAVDSQETWWHLPDRRTLRVVMNPNPQGGVTYLFDDVSEHIQLESQVTALTRVQSETLDTLKEGVAVFGSDGRLKLFNRAFAEMWTLPAELTAAQPHVDAVIKACRRLAPQDEPWVDIRGAVAGLPDMRMGFGCRMERQDGSALDCAAQPLPDGATLLTFIDVTASVNVERALKERNEALEKASRLRDEFVHHVSYELRSPLTNVIGFAQLLGDETVGALNPRQRDYADHIMRSSAALLAILNDILDLASIDTGSLALTPEIVDIRSTIEAAMRGLEDRLAESSLTVVIDTPDDIGSFVADGKRVRQILFNLLSNAVGFSSPGQSITVSARKSGGEVIFEVRDEGRGIPPEIKARIFDRFESHTLGTRHRGVGLGLSIVRSFVELHGGRIELASAPGVGTTVTCVFPNERYESPSDGRSAHSAVPSLAAE